MRSIDTSRKPDQWLRSQGLPEEKIAVATTGPMAASWQRHSHVRPRFEGHLRDDEISRIAKNYYRDITAISHNWNDLASNDFWRISLRAGETVEGLQGPVAPQPAIAENSRIGEPASRSLLAGGGLQVFLNPIMPFLCTPVAW
jgi:hypothetical protein